MHNIMIGTYAINFHSIHAMHTFPLPGAPIRDIIDAKFCCLATATDIANCLLVGRESCCCDGVMSRRSDATCKRWKVKCSEGQTDFLTFLTSPFVPLRYPLPPPSQTRLGVSGIIIIGTHSISRATACLAHSAT